MDKLICISKTDDWLANGISTCLLNSIEGKKGEIFRKLKAVCEISYFEYCVSPFPTKKISSLIKDELHRLLGQGTLLTMLRLNPEHSNLFLPLICASLAADCQSNSQKKDTLFLLDLLKHHSKEKIPFRKIDFLHSLWCLTGKSNYYEKMINVAQHGCLGDINSPFDINLSDEYAITHTVFYLTDFGRKKWPDAICKLDLVENILNQLSSKSYYENNMDLLAEYALCRLFLNLPSQELNREIKILEKNINSQGFWQGPLDMKQTLLDEKVDIIEHDFLQNYHTTLLAKEAILRFEHFPNDDHTPKLPLLVDHEEENYSKKTCPLETSFQSLISNPINSHEPKAPIKLDLILSPKTVLPALEWCYWARKLGVSLSPFKSAINGIYSEDPFENFDNCRFIKIWMLASATPLSITKNHKKIIKEATKKTYKKCKKIQFFNNFLNDREIDQLTTLAIAINILPIDKSTQKYRTFISFALNALAMNNDARSFVAIIACGIENLNSSKLLNKAWEGFLKSMKPNSLPFGWLLFSKEQTDDYIQKENLWELQAQLAFTINNASD